MRVSVAFLVSAGFVAVTAAVAYWAWIGLPPGAGIPINILGLDGVRRAASSRALIWLNPAISAVVTLALAFGPGRRPGLEAAALPYEVTMISFAGLMLVVEAALIGRATDPSFNVMRPVAMATGVLLLAIGNYLGKARQNPAFGIKTPWTLANAAVWDKTHRFIGRAMFLGGAILVALGLLLHDGNALGLSIALCSALPPITGLIWSRRLASRA
jgi:hypothetical protein